MLTILTFIFNTVANFALGLGIAYFLGPEEFGTFALVLAAATVIQCLMFEWLRLSTNRFFGDKQAAADPDIFTTLGHANAVVTFILSALSLLLYFTVPYFGFPAVVGAMAPLIGVSNGLFDFRSALARAEFQGKLYALLVILKNVLMLMFTLGGAFYWQRADLVLIGLSLSFLFSLLLSGVLLRDKPRDVGTVRRALLMQFARYGAPLIISSLLYLLNMFLTRSVVAVEYGLAESGRLSLALDLGMKVMMSIGSALDIYLFQLAVKAEAEEGMDAALTQLGHNITIIIGILLPACVGLALVLPSFEALFVNIRYRGSFSHYMLLLLPGLVALSTIHYMMCPIFQILRRTRPVVTAALVDITVTSTLLLLWPGTDGSHGAIAVTAGFFAAALVMAITVRRTVHVPIHWADITKLLLALIAMALAVWPIHAMSPGLITLMASATVGAAVYIGIILLWDVGGLRERLLVRVRQRAG